MALNVTTAVFGENCNTATASPSLAQWDKGQVLQISGVDLPDAYQVEFSTVYTRNAIPVIGNASGVQVPNELLQRSAPITACVVLHSTANSRDTEYWVTIHITPRKPPETITPDPEQADVIDQAIAALQDGPARAEAAATAAAGSATAADGSAENAKAWAVGQRAGEDVPDTDPTYRNNAKYYAGAAEAAAEEAGQHEASWESWVRRAETAADDAEGSARVAAGSKADAEAAAQTATQKATEAGNSAAAASGSASEARQTVDGAIGAINTAKEGALTAIGSAGSNAVGAVNQAGTTQTGRVTNEGNTQVNRVQAKGDEVIGSIPQDYTDLANDVADLSRQLNDETTGLDSKAPVILETVSGAIASFSDGADGMPIKKLVAQIEPVQDLHGYANPWPAGGGKNLLPLTVEGIKSANPNVTWNGNSCVYNDVNVTILTDNGNNVTGISVNGQATTNTQFFLYRGFSGNGNFILTGGVSVNLSVSVGGKGTDNGQGYSFSDDGTGRNIWLYYGPNAAVNNTVYPMIRLATEADATFAPYENICPISGRTGAEIVGCGKNLFNKNASGINPGHALSPNTGVEYSAASYSVSEFIKVTPGSSYVTSGIGDSCDACFYNSAKQRIAGVANLNNGAIAPENSVWIKFDYKTASADTVQLESNTTATDYKPYTGNQISVTFPSAAGTVYGGTVDVVSGKLIVTMNLIDLGTLTWNKATGFDYRFIGRVVNPKYYGKVICETYKNSDGGTTDKAIFLGGVGWYAGFIVVQDYSFEQSTVAKFKNAVTGIKAVYQLETPTEYQLTPQEVKTLLGVNNIWADTGDVTVTAPRDTKLYIDNKITQAIANALNS